MEKRVACYEYIPNDLNASETEPPSEALDLYCQQNVLGNIEHFIDRDGEQVRDFRLECRISLNCARRFPDLVPLKKVRAASCVA